MLLIACDTLRRAFAGVKSIEWIMLVLEALVLILIAYEVAHNVITERKRRKAIKAAVTMMTEGAFLQQRASSLRDEDVQSWLQDVKRWSVDTSGKLDRFSTQASSAFSFVEAEERSFARVHGDANRAYCDLRMRVEMLRRIMENPDAYF